MTEQLVGYDEPTAPRFRCQVAWKLLGRQLPIPQLGCLVGALPTDESQRRRNEQLVVFARSAWNRQVATGLAPGGADREG
jgi:hypothetical protein